MGADAREQRLDALVREHAECERQLADPEVHADRARMVELSRRHRELGDLVGVIGRRRELLADLDAAGDLLALADGDERTSLLAERDRDRDELERVERELALALAPSDPDDDRDVIVEIRGAEGGEEANLFARDLFEMYRSFAQRRGWTVEVLGSSPSDLGGYADITFRVAGEQVYGRMKFEAGPHRVQRVPVTESQGRVHTSSATVAVLPEADEVEVAIAPDELRVDVFRASGPGGQSVNTTDSAVRVTHLPTGLVVSMQDEKSQLQNRARAMVVLRARLMQLEAQRRSGDEAEQRRSQIGGGGRSEKVRTYNFKENRVTEHRLGMTLHQLDRVLAGELDAISDALVEDDRARRLAEGDT